MQAKKKLHQHILPKLQIVAIVTTSAVFLSGLLIVATLGYYKSRFFPNTYIAGLDFSGVQYQDAEKMLQTIANDYSSHGKIYFDFGEYEDASSSGTPNELSVSSLGVTFNVPQEISRISNSIKNNSIIDNLNTLYKSLQSPTEYHLNYEINEEILLTRIQHISENFDQPGAKPEIYYDHQNGDLQVNSGEDGYIVDQKILTANINAAIAAMEPKKISLPIILQEHQLSQERLSITKLRAATLFQKSLDITLDSKLSDESTWTLEGEDLVGFIDFYGGFDEDQITTYIESLSESIARPPENASFEFVEGKVTNFVPAKNGLVLEINPNVSRLVDALVQLESDIEAETVKLVATVMPPEIATSDVNDLGIVELIGRGTSSYKGSIPGRVHNVAHTASKLNGVLIKPGETFSFNESIGEVSRATGYQSAYVIQNGRTVLGDGGGVCQDSTTLFRAVLDAGLPITERKAHSYRVGYYEQNSKPGFDSTVFSPTVDLKFTNDTPGHILIQAIADSQNLTLVIDLYGTSDGRVAEISNYQQWDAVPAPPPLYQDDPTLAPGVVKQVDWASPGLKTKFDYVVTRDNEEIINKTFYSTYRPWQAVYLRGV